jgi:hypothetical protein
LETEEDYTGRRVQCYHCESKFEIEQMLPGVAPEREAVAQTQPVAEQAERRQGRGDESRKKSGGSLVLALLVLVLLVVGGYAGYSGFFSGGDGAAVAKRAGAGSMGGSANEPGGDSGKPAPTPSMAAPGDPGVLVSRDETTAVYLFVPKGEVKNNNGSFELGLGTSDVWPGWSFRYQTYSSDYLNDLKNPPPRPQVVEDEHFDGKRSLCLTIDNNRRECFVCFRPPFPGNSAEKKPLALSFRIKASKPGIGARFRLFGVHAGTLGKGMFKTVPTEWTRVAGVLENYGDAPGIRLDITSGGAAPAKIWIDAVSWSFGEPVDYRPPPAEIRLGPLSSDGIVFAEKPVTFAWDYRGSQERKVETVLYLRDATRDGRTFRLASRPGTLPAGDGHETVSLPRLPRGLYIAAVAVRDRGTGEILARDLQRFSVLSDLRDLPPPEDFIAGGMFVFREPYGFTSRGIWSLDDLYRVNSLIGCRMIRDLHTWEKLETTYRKRDWPYYDYLMDTASKYGCGFMLDIPGAPIKVGAGGVEKARQKNFWPVMHGRLLGNKRRVVLDEVVSRDDFVAISKNDTFWIPEMDYMKEFCREFMTRYKDRGLFVAEFKNEVDAMVPPAINVKHFMKPLYSVMKAAAPDVPVIVNNMGGSGLRYLKQLVEAGGLPYMDGFSFHPYAWSTLRFGSIENVRMYREYLDGLGSDRELLLGQSEVFFTKSLLIQRVLSDWVGGCRWSCGLGWRDYYAKEHASYGGWHNTGPLIPGLGAVRLNGMSSVLSGARRVGCVESIPNTLIGFFEKQPANKSGRYVVALCAKYEPGKALLLSGVNLAGLRCLAYDDTGEPMPLPPVEDGLLLNERPLYIASDSPNLFSAFSHPQAEWVNDAQARVMLAGSPLAQSMEMVAGTPPFRLGCTLDFWEPVREKPAPTGAPSSAEPWRVFPGSGNLIPPIPQSASLPAVIRLRTSAWSRVPSECVLAFSSFGVGKADLFLNGQCVAKNIRPDSGSLPGADETEIPVRLKAGRNLVEIRIDVSVKHPVVRAVLRPPRDRRYGELDGFRSGATRRNLVRTPGILLSTRYMSTGNDGVANPRSPIYKVLEDPNLVGYSGLRGNKRNEAEIRVQFADGRAYVLNAYHLLPRFNRFPSAWRFEGSRDGESWTILHEVSGYHPKGKNWVVNETFENRSPFRYYRFVFSPKYFMTSFKGLAFYADGVPSTGR